jgi:hypothetical protein
VSRELTTGWYRCECATTIAGFYAYYDKEHELWDLPPNHAENFNVTRKVRFGSKLLQSIGRRSESHLYLIISGGVEIVCVYSREYSAYFEASGPVNPSRVPIYENNPHSIAVAI